MYNQFDRELHPRQSELDCLMAIKEETQQLEEELALYEQVDTIYIRSINALFSFIYDKVFSPCRNGLSWIRSVQKLST